MAGQADAARSAARFRQWCEVLGDDHAAWDITLAALGLDEAGLKHTLGAGLGLARDGRTAAADEAAAWVQGVDRVLARGTGSAPEPDSVGLGLLTVAWDVVAGFQGELADRLRAGGTGPRPRELGRMPGVLIGSWPRGELTAAIHRTMVLELNVARVRGRLRGATERDRFSHYLALLADPRERHRIWAEYPVLLRYCAEILGGWVDACADLADRLIRDFGALGALAGGPLGELREVRFGAGDRHRGGRTVAILTFSGGRIVYKPRPLRADESWAGVLRWFNGQRPPYPLAPGPVLARDGYGWARFIDPAGCDSETAIGAFYWRLGALTALVHALNGVDVHAENLVAHGSQPILVDLEALLHGAHAAAGPAGADPAAELVRRGVTGTGLLPTKLVVRSDGVARSLDFGAIGASRAQTFPLRVPVTADRGTDRMRITGQYVTIEAPGHARPMLGPATPGPLGYRSQVIEGFCWAYRAITASRTHWLNVLLPSFTGVPLRFVPRPTLLYSRLLDDSLHPDFLRDAVDRDRSLVRLVNYADDVTTVNPAVLAAELADLRRGDIPYFESRPESRDLWDSTGNPISGYLSQPPIEAARARIAELGEADLAAQKTLIHRAFEAMHDPRAATAVRPLPLSTAPIRSSGADRTAHRLALELCTEAVRGPAGVGWLAVNLIDESLFEFGPATMDLYSGVLGIGLFLSTVAARTAAPKIRNVATAVADSVARRAFDEADAVGRRDTQGRHKADGSATPGAFRETGGMIYYLSHAAVLHGGSGGLLDAAEALVPVLARQVVSDTSLDLVHGSAGAILALLALYQVRPAAQTLAAAQSAAGKLLDTAMRDSGGLSWRVPFEERPLTGMSHGAAGIAYALGRLHAVAPDPGLVTAIAGALRYEHAQFDPGTGDWKDLRTSRQERGPMLAWCHGAPGIGLARIGLLREPALHTVHDQARADLQAATDRARAAMFGPGGRHLATTGQHGLCHGDLGNLEFLALASPLAAPDAGSATAHAARSAEAIRRFGQRWGWRTGTLSASAAPGLMYGRAGIGYGLLRLADPGHVPSILLLEPPPARPAAQK